MNSITANSQKAGSSASSRFTVSRRRFLAGAGTALAAQIVPRRVLAGGAERSPNEKLNLAFIGVGGRGGANLNGLKGENVVALCDVDSERAQQAFQRYPRAKIYSDFRKMLDEMDRAIDGVVISTPDHTHAVAAMDAIQRDKHVYCEKPLAHSIHEVRALMKAAREHHVVTQLGNQGHSFDSIRTFCEWIWDGAIGSVHTIHASSSANHCKIDQLSRLTERPPVPATLDWDLWLGPAEFRSYHPVYLPGRWRGWSAFGSGAIGDWTCHVVDPVFWALDLGSPTSVQAAAEGYDPKKHFETFPNGTVVTFEFPAKGNRGPVKMVWFDGVETVPRPAELEADDRIPDTGAVVMGDKGGIMYGSHGAGHLRIFPDAKMDAYRQPEKTLPRVKDHYEDWVDAIRSGGKAGSDFAYGGPLTEIALLGIIATRLLGTRLEWDSSNSRFTNSPEGNALIQPPYRKGWNL